MDAHLTNAYLARAREILGDRTDTKIEYDDRVVAFLAKGMDIKSAVDAANREHPEEALKPDPAHWEDLTARYDYISQHIKERCRTVRRLDWPAFLRHSKTGQTNRLVMKT